MSFPWVFHSNFETGDNSEWDSETDTENQVDIAHYSDLARFPWSTAAPYRGAYCLRVALSGGTADAFLTEGDVNIAADGVLYSRFMIWFSPTFTATADDTFNILEFQETGAAAMVTFGARVVAATNVINLGIGKAAPTTFGGAIERGVWYAVELAITLDDGGTNDGTVDIYVTPAGRGSTATTVYAAQVASLDQTAVTHAVLGCQDHLETTTGVFLIDEVFFDDARIYANEDRYPESFLLTKTGHIFVGNGCIENATLLSGAGTDNILSIFDTDAADVNDAANMVAQLKNTANNETVDPAGMPRRVTRGAYVQLSGTNPRALVNVGYSARSAALVRKYGIERH